MRKLRFGIIGCGRISSKHIRALRDLSELAELVAVCDINPERVDRTAKANGIKAYTDFREMIRNERLDVVSILTWSGTHSQLATECAPFVPNVVVEKPMALTMADADRMIETSQKHGSRLFIVKQNRYNPPVVALRKALDAGRFGKLVLGTVRVRWARYPEYYQQDAWRGTWALDGGVFANQASHHIDLLQWLMGDVLSVHARMGTYLAPIEAEDTGIATLKFANGAMGIVEATTCTRPKDLEGSVSIMGERGCVEIAGFAVNKVRHWEFAEPRPEDARVLDTSTDPPDVYGFGHLELLKDVIRTINGMASTAIDGVEGRCAVRLINALYESAESGQEVFLDKFKPSLSRLGRTNSQ